jgi:hypothetical protein
LATFYPERPKQCIQRLTRLGWLQTLSKPVQIEEQLAVREALSEAMGCMHDKSSFADPGHPVDR